MFICSSGSLREFRAFMHICNLFSLCFHGRALMCVSFSSFFFLLYKFCGMNTQQLNSEALITASDQLLLKDKRDPRFTIESSSRGYSVMHKTPFNFQSFQRLRLYGFTGVARTHTHTRKLFQASKPFSLLLS